MQHDVPLLCVSSTSRLCYEVQQWLCVLSQPHGKPSGGCAVCTCVAVQFIDGASLSVLCMLLQVIYRVSVAAAPLAAWVKANIAYSKVGGMPYIHQIYQRMHTA